MDPGGTALLQVCELSIVYAGAAAETCAVSGVSLSVAPGEAVGLLGESGSGKSSIALALVGLLPAHARVAGSIAFRGGELVGLPERRLESIRGARIATIYQEPELALNPVLTAGSQIIQVLRAHRALDAGEARDRALTLLRDAGVAEDALRIFESYPHQLSGGERQRVLVAQALAGDPELIIADEPTASVDAAVQADILRMLRELQRTRRVALLFISHSPAVLAAVTDRLCVLAEGRIVEEGPTGGVLAAPVHPCTRRLVDSSRLGRRPPAAPAQDAPHEPLVEIQDLAKTYTRRGRLFGRRGTVTALDGASLEISAGATVGLVGPSGSGKSTLARCLVRLEEPDRGSIRFRGVDVRRLRGEALARYRREVQLIFQDPAGALNPRFTADEIVAEPLDVQRIGTRHERRRRARELMTEVGLSPSRAGDPPAAFSGGERQRLAIARALALDPSLLVLDEAFSGLDRPVQRQILELLERLRQTRGLACLVISHDLALVAEMSDRVLVMRGGRVVESSAAHEPIRLYA